MARSAECSHRPQTSVVLTVCWCAVCSGWQVHRVALGWSPAGDGVLAPTYLGGRFLPAEEDLGEIPAADYRRVLGHAKEIEEDTLGITRLF